MARSYWQTVSLVTLWQVAASICYYSVFAATPFFKDAFALSRFTVGIVVTTLTLGYALFLLPLGAATDRFGERRTLTLGLAGLATSVLLVAGAPTYAVLLLAVFLLGSLYGTAMPGTNKALFDNIDRGRQNMAMGIKQVGVTGGSGISALLVTGLAGVLFWQVGFLVAAGFGLFVTLVFFAFYPADSGGNGTLPNFGALLSNGSYLALVSAGFFLGGSLFTTTGYTVLYVEESVGSTVAFGGVVLALVQLSGSVGRLVTGWLSDVLPGEPRIRIAGVLIVQASVAAPLFVLVSTVTSRLGVAVAFAALGFFVLGYTGVYYSCLATLVDTTEMGGATAGGQLALTSGGLFVPPAFGYLADTIGYRGSWWLLAGLCLVAAGLLVFVVRIAPPVSEPAMRD
jgi:MFS family permease